VIDVKDTLWHRFLRQPYKLSSVDVGHGSNVAVLLHGLGSSNDMWPRLIGRLAPEHWRIIAPDLLGFGESPRPQWNKYSTHEHARMVIALLRRKRIKGQVTLVGHSMGCLVAAHIAAIKPRLVKQLVLYEPPLLGEIPEFPMHTKRSARYKTLFEYIASNPKVVQLNNKTMWRVARKIYGMHLSQERWLSFEMSLRNTILSQKAYNQLKAIKVPTDIVYGRLDLVVIRRGVEDMFKHNTNVKLHLVTDGHSLSESSANYLAGLLNLLDK
jgi:pimeloyl-ACP methyl ester carboxylesterase